MIVDQPYKDGAFVVGAGHCVDHMARGGDKFEITENNLTWTTQSGQKISQKIVEIFEAELNPGDYAIAKLDRPISRFDIEPLVNAPYHYSDLLDPEFTYSNDEPFKAFPTMAGYSADAKLGQKGEVLTYDDSERCVLNGGGASMKKGRCWSYEGASGGAVAVTLFLNGDLDGDAGALGYFIDDFPNIKSGPYTFWVGSIVGSRTSDGYDKTLFTDASYYSRTLSKVLAEH